MDTDAFSAEKLDIQHTGMVFIRQEVAVRFQLQAE